MRFLIPILLAATLPCAAHARQCVKSAPHSTATLSVAAKLGTAISEARYEDMSSEVIERAKWTLLDNIATLAYTSSLTRRDPYVLRAQQKGGAKEALAWGMGVRMPVEDAAAANAWMIHAAETDDTDFRASLRASPVVMGPALAMAERQGGSGKDFLLSIAIGYTVLGRLAEPLGPLQLKGYMSSGVWGPSSAAAVSAKLLKLNAPATANAIAIAAGAGGGSFQYFYDQTEEKRLVVARAARAGTEAALLACAGEQGAQRVFEGQAGLYRLFGGTRADSIDYARISSDFGNLEGPLRLYPKFFAASASIIPFLEAMPAERVDPADIDYFIVRGNDDAARIYKAKLEQYEAPKTLIGAKTSLGFVLALYLTRGSADPFDFTSQTLTDPAINALAATGRFEHMKSPATELVLVLKSGERITLIPFQSDGSKTEPFMREARLTKFRSLTRHVLTGAEQDQIIQEVMALDRVSHVKGWLRRIEAMITKR
ncbi:MmgE/PrpD [Sphingomonadaceae bacterium]|jgi:2-methylcitrate dehydratase PrpD